MDVGSLLLFVALLVLCGLYVARPLLAGAEEDTDPHLANLHAEHRRVLDALLELDADWEMGKVPEEIYHPQRQQLLAEGAAALRALEKVDVDLPAAPSDERDELEAMIAAYKKKDSKKGARQKGAPHKP
ncbi:MAG: hypothetical protein KF701_05455 [Anaerolineales bacterium]|nr:MAG: hypothetical protein KF701_05455 [Anaerolineales bacterium]